MSDDLNRLVSAARRHQTPPTAGQRAKMKRAALVAAALGAGSASALSLTKLIVVGVVAATVGSAVTAGVVRSVRPAPSPAATRVLRAMPPPPAQPMAIEPAPAAEAPPAEPAAEAPKAAARTLHELPRAPAVSPPVAHVEAPPPAALAEAVETPPVPAAHVAAPAPVVAPVPSSGGSREIVASGLSIELGLIRRATEAVDARDFDAAEGALNTYEAQVRAGALATEAGVLRVVVDCARGRSEAALALARKWVAADPSNPALGRLRGSCAAAALTP